MIHDIEPGLSGPMRQTGVTFYRSDSAQTQIDKLTARLDALELRLDAHLVDKRCHTAPTMTPEEAPHAVVYGDQGRIVSDILDERQRQNARWGRQRQTWPEWMSVLTEEVGEAAQAANQAYWPTLVLEVHTPEVKRRKLISLRTELVQTAAVAVQIIEHIDELLVEEAARA